MLQGPSMKLARMNSNVQRSAVFPCVRRPGPAGDISTLSQSQRVAALGPFRSMGLLAR